jgi:hypothetical protein
MTFKETRAKHLEDLKAMGWTVALRDRSYRELKTPYATSPGGQWRLWFKAQAVYFLHGPPFDFGNARSLAEDMRQPTAQLLRILDRAAIWEQKNYPEGREVERVSLVVSGAFAGPEDELHRNAGSGYTHCPCCGYDTVSSDMDEPELCSDCEEAGCDPDGSDPQCENVLGEEMRENAGHSEGAPREPRGSRVGDSIWPDWLPGTEVFVTKEPDGLFYLWWDDHQGRVHWTYAYKTEGQALKEQRSKARRSLAKHRQNPSEEYWVWAVDKKNQPLTGEGPWGPYDYQAARTYSRISATKGKHDRAVSRGRDPKAASFEIVRVYRAGSGEHKYGVAQMIGAPMQANGDVVDAGWRFRKTRYEPTWGQIPDMRTEGPVGKTGAVYEFNVKLPKLDVELSDDEFYVETDLAVRAFADTLRDKYDWVGEVYQTGRSGGWLAVQDRQGKARERSLRQISELVQTELKKFVDYLTEEYGT